MLYSYKILVKKNLFRVNFLLLMLPWFYSLFSLKLLLLYAGSQLYLILLYNNCNENFEIIYFYRSKTKLLGSRCY